MAEWTAQAPQTVAVGANVLFTDTVYKPCPAVAHRERSGIFTLRGGHQYLLFFGANITGATANVPVTLAITIGGEQIPATEMTVTPAVAAELNNVARAVWISVPCGCCYNVSVENITADEITVQNANLIIIKED